MVKIDRQNRMIAFDVFENLKKSNLTRKEMIDRINKEFGIPIMTLYDWYKSKHLPYGRKGSINYIPETFYILGALLGDGCLYRWKPTNNYTILIGDKKFTEKYAKHVIKCTGKNAKSYINRSKNIWFVKVNNYNLYKLFENSRKNLNHLKELILRNGKDASLLFIEGFFDAEGCVKIIKEKVRKTPKICLDITNTNLELLKVVEDLLKDCLSIEAKYSIQKPHGNRKTAYHLRIYKKSEIKKFLEKIKTTKLKEEKIQYVKNWINNGK